MKINYKSKKSFFSKTVWKRLLWSVIISFILIFLGYFVNNWSLFTGENLNQYYLTQVVCEKLGISHLIDNEDAFFVNVSYDKAIAQIIDENLDTLGNTAVTDRTKLCKFLQILHHHPNYKYIILDLRFDKHDITDSDQELYELICDMDHIVIVRDDNVEFSTQCLYDKSAYAQYYSTIIDSNFIRFTYLDSNNRLYIPLKVFEDLNPDCTLIHHKLLGLSYYTQNGSLCQNGCFILFDRSKTTGVSECDEDGNAESMAYFNLGADLLQNKEIASEKDREQNIIDKAEDAFVVIGNYTEDLHDTYMGMKAGPYILYRALKTLENRSNLVKAWTLLYWFIIYLVISYFILSRFHILNVIRKIPTYFKKVDKKVLEDMPKRMYFSKLNSGFKVLIRIIYFFIEILGYATVLFIFSTLEYVFTDTITSLVLPTLVFFVMKLVIDYKYSELQNTNI